MELQHKTLGKVTAALCPECHASALYRSHTTSTLEEKRKKFGRKRPYRCHECSWRGWLEDAELRYSAEGMKQKTLASAQEDVDVPDISLDMPLPADDGETRPGRIGPPACTADDTGASVAPIPAEDAAPPAEGAAPKSDVHQDSQDSLPHFENGAQEPVSSKVSPGFHHRSRNKTHACPKCGEHALYRSHSRGVSETLRKKMTNRRPYRCHRCGWRGWLSKGF